MPPSIHAPHPAFSCSPWLPRTHRSAQADVNVPLEEAWGLWEERELIPNWMPWITSVRVLPEDPRMSRWTLSWYQFNRQWEFSWLAENLTPMRHQKLHWRSVPGSVGGSLGGALEVQNRGQIRFVRKSPTSCSVKLTISYEVPSPMGPFASVSAGHAPFCSGVGAAGASCCAAVLPSALCCSAAVCQP